MSATPSKSFLHYSVGRNCNFFDVCGTKGNVARSRVNTGDPLDNKPEQKDFLARAKEAEEQAKKSGDEASKASWLRIAAGYHDLAARQDSFEH